MPSTTHVQHTINRLRAIADLLLIHHDFFMEHSYEAVMEDKNWDDRAQYTYLTYYTSGGGLSISIMGPDAKTVMRELRQRLRPGIWQKQASGSRFVIRTPYDADLPSIDIDAQRDAICVKRVTGTKIVTHPPIEAQPERTETVEEVEWDCGNLLDDDEPQTSLVGGVEHGFDDPFALEDDCDTDD